MKAAALSVLLLAGAARAYSLPTVEVAPGGHMLRTHDGAPFFWLADTAWELIHRATPDEQRFYLRARARQGFTVIQTVVLAEQDGLTAPTPDGLLPFDGGDPAHPNRAYFDRVASVVDEAAADGLYVALLPSWGDKLTAPWGAGPRVFTTARAARAYGRFLGERLKVARTSCGCSAAIARPGWTAILAVMRAAPAGRPPKTGHRSGRRWRVDWQKPASA